MDDLSEKFDRNPLVVLDVRVSPHVNDLLTVVQRIAGDRELCIGGGYGRGLYMQQAMSVDPQMNDIDIFTDISVEEMATLRPILERTFGQIIRFHEGRFEEEPLPRGLMEFRIPQDMVDAFGGVDSIQFNYGEAHPWARPEHYIASANLGTNQIVIDRLGGVRASRLFVNDMNDRTLTMNPDLVWTHSNWSRTKKSIERLLSERFEFEGWRGVLLPEPPVRTAGAFWDQCRDSNPALRM